MIQEFKQEWFTSMRSEASTLSPFLTPTLMFNLSMKLTDSLDSDCNFLVKLSKNLPSDKLNIFRKSQSHSKLKLFWLPRAVWFGFLHYLFELAQLCYVKRLHTINYCQVDSGLKIWVTESVNYLERLDLRALVWVTSLMTGYTQISPFKSF